MPRYACVNNIYRKNKFVRFVSFIESRFVQDTYSDTRNKWKVQSLAPVSLFKIREIDKVNGKNQFFPDIAATQSSMSNVITDMVYPIRIFNDGRRGAGESELNRDVFKGREGENVAAKGVVWARLERSSQEDAGGRSTSWFVRSWAVTVLLSSYF